MRAFMVLALGLCACSDAERAGAEAARQQAAQEQAAKGSGHTSGGVRHTTPVPGDTRVPCSQLIDAAAFQTALGEKQPVTVKDVTRSNRDATSSCQLLRGGRRPSEAEQQAIEKHAGRLGVLPGDELCNVTAYCWTVEEPDRFRARCKERKELDDESLGSYACVHMVAVGADDVKVYQLLDDDTRCVLQIRGGPSNVDNELIKGCARAARDSIGPAQIKVDPTGTGSTGSAG